MLIAYSYRTVILSLVEQGGVGKREIDLPEGYLSAVYLSARHEALLYFGKRTVFRVFRVDLLIYLKSAFQNRS